jgi:hypothetical protein
MNQNYKAVLLTILTLSVFTLTIIELTGVSSTALFNKFHANGASVSEQQGAPAPKFKDEATEREKKVAEMPHTTMKFYDTTLYNFGTVKEGEKVKHAFRFKNTGDNPLMIARTVVSCGCTVTSYSLQPVAPGAEGEITVEFNTSGKSGHQQKNVIVHSNAQPEAVSIGFQAEVK